MYIQSYNSILITPFSPHNAFLHQCLIIIADRQQSTSCPPWHTQPILLSICLSVINTLNLAAKHILCLILRLSASTPLQFEVILLLLALVFQIQAGNRGGQEYWEGSVLRGRGVVDHASSLS